MMNTDPNGLENLMRALCHGESSMGLWKILDCSYSPKAFLAEFLDLNIPELCLQRI